MNCRSGTEAKCERPRHRGHSVDWCVLAEGSASYDKKAKLLGYARVGVAEYWIVSPEEGSLERLVLRRGKYVVERVLTRGEQLSLAGFPGLVVPLDELFTLTSRR